MFIDFERTFYPTIEQEIERANRLLSTLEKERKKNPQKFCKFITNTAKTPFESNPLTCSKTGKICEKKCGCWVDNGLIKFHESFLKRLQLTKEITQLESK